MDLSSILKEIQEETLIELQETNDIPLDGDGGNVFKFVGRFINKQKPGGRGYDLMFVVKSLISSTDISKCTNKDKSIVEKVKFTATKAVVFVKLDTSKIIEYCLKEGDLMKSINSINKFDSNLCILVHEFLEYDTEVKDENEVEVQNEVGLFRSILFGYALKKVISISSDGKQNPKLCILSINGSNKIEDPESLNKILFPLPSCFLAGNTKNTTTTAMTEAMATLSREEVENVLRGNESVTREANQVIVNGKEYCSKQGRFSSLTKHVYEIEVINKKGMVTNVVKHMKQMNHHKKEEVVLNVIPTKKEYLFKKTMFLMDMFNPDVSSKQLFATCQDSSSSIQETLDFRQSLLLDSYVVRYGEQIAKGVECKETVTSIACATLKLEMLSVGLNRKVNFDSWHGDEGESQKSVFVLYNYARLCKLEKSLNEKISAGEYEAMSVNDVDFSCLTEELEWQLVRDYIFSFPLLFQEIIENVSSSVDGQRLDVAIQKIFSFLLDLSSTLSKYYKQTKVLLKPEPHLKMLLFARFNLMMSLKKVMEICFDVFAIKPPTEM